MFETDKRKHEFEMYSHILELEGVRRNDPKFSNNRYAWANSADPDQTAPDQGLPCLPFRLHCFCKVEPHSSNFRVIATNCLGVRVLGNLRY